MMKDLGLELYMMSFELELMETELEKSKAAFRWLVENGGSNGESLGCPYHRFFDTNKKCPLWTPRIASVSDDAPLEEWKELVFGEDDYCDDIDCGTHPSLCWRTAYELSHGSEVNK